jgi:hypothetical protein
MKKLVIALFLTSGALGFLISPAMAADPPRAAPVLSAADQAFIASLAAPVKTPSAPELIAKRPPVSGAREKSDCPINCDEERALCESDCLPCPFSFSCNLSTCTISCQCRFHGCF